MNIKKGKYKSAKKLIKQFLSRLDSQDLMENRALKRLINIFKFIKVNQNSNLLKKLIEYTYIYI